MTTCDSEIEKFILEWRIIVSLLEDRGVVLTDEFKILRRAFGLFKDAYFVEYMGRKQEAHEEDEIPTLSLTVYNILNFALDKYKDQSRINNHVCGSSSKMEAKFVALAAKVTTLPGILNLSEEIANKQKPNEGGGVSVPKARTGDKGESKK